MRWLAAGWVGATIGASAIALGGGCGWLLDLSPGVLDYDAGTGGSAGATGATTSASTASASSSSGEVEAGPGPCVEDADCPPPIHPECRTMKCEQGVCVPHDVSSGKVLTQQTAGDCKELRCDGDGGVMAVNADDPLIDGKECTNDLCDQGVPTNTPKLAGKGCHEGTGKVCDGEGACVECLFDGQCSGQICVHHACVPVTCGDGQENNDETDIDCGGASCPRCGACASCMTDADCDAGRDLSCLQGTCGPCADAG